MCTGRCCSNSIDGGKRTSIHHSAHEPNRFGALYGSARSAERSGDMTKAREFYAALVTVAPDSRRQEVQHARDFLASLRPGA